MKELLLTNCEKTFINRCIEEGKRIDGRSLTEFRNLRINFGNAWGSVHVSLGETRVLAQVSCDVMQPKSSRPNEGLLHINVEIGPMAAPHFEAGRQTDLTVHVNRILERALKDSRAIDLESLCIVADDKVWNLRVDINVLNHEGNIIDCASVAALSALAHFKRPDVTTSGDEVIIHTHAEKDPIPIPLHHYPVCVSYAIFGKGLISVADPTALEEKVAEASMVFGLNSYKELCGLHLGGITLTNSQLLLQCANKAGKRAKKVVELIKTALAEDGELRAAEKPVGFNECIRLNKITSLSDDLITIKLKKFNLDTCTDENQQPMQAPQMEDYVEPEVQQINEESAVLIPPEIENAKKSSKSKWIPDESDSDVHDDSDSDMEEIVEEVVKPKKRKVDKKNKAKHQKEKDASDSNSEEENTIIL